MQSLGPRCQDFSPGCTWPPRCWRSAPRSGQPCSAHSSHSSLPGGAPPRSCWASWSCWTGGPMGLGGEKGPESRSGAWQKRRERTESQVIVKVQIGEKSSNKRTSWCAVCLIKHSGKACLTAAAAAPRGWRTPSFNFNHSLVLHTYCRGSKNEFLHYKRHNEKVKCSKKSFSSSTVLKTEKTKNTKSAGEDSADGSTLSKWGKLYLWHHTHSHTQMSGLACCWGVTLSAGICLLYFFLILFFFCLTLNSDRW